MRVAIIGGPRCGKSTYATALAKKSGALLLSTGKPADESVVRTDSYLSLGWDAIPDNIIAMLRGQDDFILEGCQAARVLRRWYRDDAKGPRLDKVIIFSKPHVSRSGGQEAMAKGITRIIDGLLPVLKRNKVRVELNPTEDP